MDKYIAITYDLVTEESAREGDVAEYGYATPNGELAPIHDNETGEDFPTPTEAEIKEYYSVDMGEDLIGWEDPEDEMSAVDNAVEFLADRALEASDSMWHQGTWYNSEGEQDMHTGDWTTFSYHLKGFTAEEEELIFHGWKRARGYGR